jgi:signal transduction histidine kinase
MNAAGAALGSDPLSQVLTHRRKYLVQIVIVFLGYVVAGKLGQATANIRSSNLGPVWPAYGIAVAAVLIYGYRVWLGIALAAFVIAFFSPVPLLAALGQAAAATLAALTGALLLHHFTNFQKSMSRLSDAVGLIVLGGSVSAMVSASIGVSALYAAHVQAYSGLKSAWLIYWLGDATGVLLITPLALTFTEVLKLHNRNRVAELLALMLLLCSSCFVVFGDLPSFPVKLHVMAFAVLPFVMWAAVRLGVAATALSVFLVATIATIETALGSGPFASNSPFLNAVLLDVFFAVISVTGLTLAAVTAEREDAKHRREQIVRQQALMEERLRAEQGMRRKLIEAQEQERTRIARDLHDDVAQRLALVAIEVEQLELEMPTSPAVRRTRMDGLHQKLVEISSSVQAISHELHSSKLTYLGIVTAMKSFCQELGELHKVEIAFKSHGVPDSVPSDVSLCLFRVLQEGLHNAVKYSGVAHFDVQLWGTLAEVHLAVSDDGKGFDLASAMKDVGLGLTSMRERVKIVNGEFSIDSRPQRGTTIYARVPLATAP